MTYHEILCEIHERLTNDYAAYLNNSHKPASGVSSQDLFESWVILKLCEIHAMIEVLKPFIKPKDTL